MSVDLPQPFWPISAWTSPRRTSKSTRSRALVPGNVLLRPRIVRTVSTWLTSLRRADRGGARARLAQPAHGRTAGERDRGDQGPALEGGLAPDRRGACGQDQALDAEGQREVRDQRAPDVRAPRELRGAEEHGGHGGEQVTRPDARRVQAALHREDDARQPCDRAARDEDG